MEVLEELEEAVALGCLEDGHPVVVAGEADSRVGTLAADRVAAQNAQHDVGVVGDS